MRGHAAHIESRGRDVYWSPRWRVVRRAVVERDGWRCVHCGKGGMLEVHHVKELKDGGAAFDVSNLKTLCRACHFDVHRKHGTDQALTEWRDLVDTSDNNKRRGINA